MDPSRRRGEGRAHLHLALDVRMEYMIRLHFTVSNNIAEYKALLNGLMITLEIGVRCLEV
jgi:ribonuclease HI